MLQIGDIAKIKKFIKVEPGLASAGHGNTLAHNYSQDSVAIVNAISGFGYGTEIGTGYGIGNTGDIFTSDDENGYGHTYHTGLGCGSGEGSGLSTDSDFVSESSVATDINSADLKFLNDYPVFTYNSRHYVVYHVFDNYASAGRIYDDMTITPYYIAKYYNIFGEGETIEDAVLNAKALYRWFLSKENLVNHLIEQFPNLDTIVNPKELRGWSDCLATRTVRSYKEFCIENNIDQNTSFTMRQFLSLIKDPLDKTVAKKLKEKHIL